MGKFFSFVYDLFCDGYKVAGVSAPFLSISFTVAKFFGADLMWIKELSYAWAFLPLLIWVLIAYVRKRGAFASLVDEFDHCLFLDHVQPRQFQDTDNNKINYDFALRLKNTANKPIKYRMKELVINDHAPDDYDNRSGVIGPQSDTVFYSPKINSGEIPSVNVISLKIIYGSTKQPMMRFANKKIRLIPSQLQFTYLLDEDSPFKESGESNVTR